MPVTYVCENGHKHGKHKSQPSGHDSRPACMDCGGVIVNRKVPLYECDDCEYYWFYKGGADKPTCPNCKGKRTRKANDE